MVRRTFFLTLTFRNPFYLYTKTSIMIYFIYSKCTYSVTVLPFPRQRFFVYTFSVLLVNMEYSHVHYGVKLANFKTGIVCFEVQNKLFGNSRISNTVGRETVTTGTGTGTVF